MTGGGVDEEEADKYLHSLYQAHYFALFLKLFFPSLLHFLSRFQALVQALDLSLLIYSFL